MYVTMKEYTAKKSEWYYVMHKYQDGGLLIQKDNTLMKINEQNISGVFNPLSTYPTELCQHCCRTIYGTIPLSQIQCDCKTKYNDCVIAREKIKADIKRWHQRHDSSFISSVDSNGNEIFKKLIPIL